MTLIRGLASTEDAATIFSDSSVLQAMLDVESAIARAEARVGIIPQKAALKISEAARAELYNHEDLAKRILRAGTPAIPVVDMLTASVRQVDSDSAGWVHWGATSQDIADTAIVLLLKRARPMLAADERRIDTGLTRLAENYGSAIMLGRTLLQAGPPITFGLKAAGWLGVVRRTWSSVERAFNEALVLQFGGAVGTLAALGDHGLAVSEALAEELDLRCPPAPWHSHRDRLATLMTAIGVYAGALGKIAVDVALLTQDEVAEVTEPGGDGRGGSSTMAHKRNPIASVLAIAAARQIPGLVSNFLQSMIQEQERAAGGWQAEWSTIANIVELAMTTTASIGEVAEGLSVRTDSMRDNIEATHGAIFAEQAMLLIGRKIGRDKARSVLEKATRQMRDEACTLNEVLAKLPELEGVLTAEEIAAIGRPENYLGSADVFRTRLLSQRS